MQSVKLTRNQLKLFAMLTMTLNHFAHIFGLSGIFRELLIGIGYFTAPCMCYFLVEGYYHTRSVRKYALRLIVLALVSQLPFNLAFNGNLWDFSTFNMMFTLFFCLCICAAYDKLRAPGQFLIRISAIAALTAVCYICDWYFLAPVMVILILMKRKGRISGGQAYIFMAVLYIYCNFLKAWENAAAFTKAATNDLQTILWAGLFMAFYMIGPCLVTWGIRHYDSTVNNHGSGLMKWFFYFYYPAHILVLLLLSMI